MDESNKLSQEETGPDDDHHTLGHHKVDECRADKWKSGIFSIERSSSQITEFLRDVTYLREQDEVYGLIWDKNLEPCDGKYEHGEHYLSTRESSKKSTHATVSFYRDGATGAKFAVKTLQKGDHFHPEEVKIGLLEIHQNICSVYGIIVRDECVHILMEHAGSSLTEERSWIAESADRMLSLAKQGFQALEVLHKHGYVHCDVKPDNIMISKSKDETDFTVKLIDFGSCQRVGTALTEHSHTTLFYWSPEIWQALDQKEQVTCAPANDVYALALTFYFVQTSNHLMQSIEDIKLLMTKMPGYLLSIAQPETIPTELRGVMRPCLDANPSNRWTAQQAVKQLTADSMMQQPFLNFCKEANNYKVTFEKLYSQLRHINPQSSSVGVIPPTLAISELKTDMTPASFPFSQTTPETSGVQYFVGSSKGKELTAKKVNSISSKFNKPFIRPKRLPKPSGKTKPVVKRSASSNETSASISQTAEDVVCLSPPTSTTKEDKGTNVYSCSNLLKTLASQAQTSTTAPQELLDDNMQNDAKLHTVKLSEKTVLKSNKGKFGYKAIHNPDDTRGKPVSSMVKLRATAKQQSGKVNKRSHIAGRIVSPVQDGSDMFIHPSVETNVAGSRPNGSAPSKIKDMLGKIANSSCENTQTVISKPNTHFVGSSQAFNQRESVSLPSTSSDCIKNPFKENPFQNAHQVVDEMDFVFDALVDVKNYTGEPDDILDALCSQLDQEEGDGFTLPDAESPMEVADELTDKEISSEEKSTLAGSFLIGERQESPMQTSTQNELMSRKRVAVTKTNIDIPEKIIVNEMPFELPKFDQILPEHK